MRRNCTLLNGLACALIILLGIRTVMLAQVESQNQNPTCSVSGHALLTGAIPHTDSLTNASSQSDSHLPQGAWMFTTSTYKDEALRALIAEVNAVVRDLGLPEKQPVTRTDLVEAFIAPPAMWTIGTASTSNYVYYVTFGRKFTGLDHKDLVGSFYRAKAEYRWPRSRLDKNGALRVASEIMRRAGFDIAALNRDCTVEIHASFEEEKTFLPNYRISWLKRDRQLAYIEFVEPTRMIRQMHVEDPNYILRKPVEVPNMINLLREGGAPEVLLQRIEHALTSAASNPNLH